MKIGNFKLFGEYFRAYSSEAYNETMHAFETLASASLLLLDRKPEEERRQILAKAQEITQELLELVANESPMVGALGLLTAVRVHERLIQERAKKAPSDT
jgi:hypothetical protein